MRTENLVFRAAFSLSLLALLLGAMPAAGAPITLSYSGVIDSVTDPDGLLDPQVALGATFTVDLSFDPATATPSLIFDLTRYDTTPDPGLTVSFGGAPLTQTLSGLAVDNDSTLGPPGGDFWGGLIELTSPGIYINFAYSDFTGALLSDESFFVPSESDFTGWSLVGITFIEFDGLGSTDLAFGTIFAVPEPGTASLVMLGLAAFARRCRDGVFESLR